MATVLIVEDEFAIVDLLEMALADEGYRVLTAANGHQGLERLVAGPRPDLVIADYMMPVLDGAGLLRAMRETETHRNIPCIIMSASHATPATQELFAQESNFFAFLAKPFQIPDLKAKIEQAIAATPK